MYILNSEYLSSNLSGVILLKKVTMDDIAELVGVSKSTVSRALRNDPRVNDDTREQIANIAKKLNYRPHQVARALANKNTNIIGVVLPWFPRNVADPFFLEFLQGIGEVAVEEGYSLTLLNIDPDDLANFFHRDVDGFILTEPVVNDPRIKYLKEYKTPFVFLGNPMDDGKTCWVDIDNQTGAYLAVKYLIEQGHRRIATIAGPDELVAGQYRYRGYKKAMLEYGLEIDEDLIYRADFTQKGARKAIEELLDRNTDCTAIFVANDLMAITVIKALKEKGYNIPEDIAVMGFDGIHLGEFIDPPLSTIKSPSLKMGRMALKLLLELVQNREPEKRHLLVEPELVLRNSS